MKMKKLLSVLLALAMILCACNVLVLAEGETIVVGQGDDLQSIIDSMENGSTLVLGEDIDLSVTYVAQIGTKKYETLAAAFAAVQEGETIELLAGTISEGTIKMPATLKNVTIKGADDAVIKDTTISASDGNSYSYVGLTFDGIVFDNSRLLFTGWRNGDEIIEDLTVTNCTFKNLNDDTNTACVHINKDVSEPVNGFTFTNNVIDGATGGSKSGIYSANTGNVTITGNTFNNIVFRPALVQLADCDGIADNVVIANNKISNTTRLQVYGSETDNGDGTWTPSGTDTLEIAINENIFENISGYYICTWGISGDTDISENYYDTTDLGGKIYWNNEKPADEAGLAEIGVYPIYTELNDDGTIDTDSAYNPVQNNYVAKIGDVEYETLAEAVAAAVDGDTVQLSAGTFEPIDFGGKDINLIGTVADDGTLLTVFEGGNPALKMHNVNGTVKDIKIINASRGVYAEPAGNVTFDNVDMFNCTYGLHLIAYSDDVVWNVQNCEMDLTWANSFGSYNADGATINIKNNVFKATNPYYGSDAEVLSVNSFSDKTTIENNVFGENARIALRTEKAADSVVIGANYYADGYENAIIVDEGCYEAKIGTYYEDEAMTKLVVALPTATVEDIEVPHLTFAKRFTADDVITDVSDYYGNWFADFAILIDGVNENPVFNASPSAESDGYLSGQYDAWSAEGYDPSQWLNVPFEDVEIKAGEPFRIMEYAATLNKDFKITYADALALKVFNCGIFFSSDYIAANPDLKVTLQLNVYNPEDETEVYTIGQSYSYDKMPTYVASVKNEAGYNQGYETLQEAIDAANGKTVTVLTDIELTESVTVANGNVVTLDLNGHKITVAYDEETGKHIYALDNKGTLTLKDSVGTGSVTARGIYNNGVMVVESGSYNAIDDNGGAAIFNCADLTVNGGTFYGATAAINNRESATAVINNATINGGAASYALQNNGGTLTVENATVLGNFGAVGTWGGLTTINNGTYSHTGNYGAHVVYVGDGKVVINGGTFKDDTNNTENYQYTILVNKSDAIVEINDGTFFGVVSPNGNVIIADNIGTVKISGGNFTGSLTKGDTSNVNIAISGGTFTEKPADEYVADGYEATANEDGTYGIVEAKDIFGVIFNIINKPKKTVDGTEYYQVGFYSGIDSLKYQSVGFEIYCDGVTISKTSTKTVYSSVSVTNSSGTTTTIKADAYGVYRLFGINALFPEKYNNKLIEFRVYAVDMEGNTIYSKLCKIEDIYTKETV